MNGVFAVRKPSGPTSQDVVSKLKHLFTKSPEYKKTAGPKKRAWKQKFIKIGHGGTLDPLADGTLVIGVGSGTKQLANYLGQCTKVYTATALLGASTTTYDSQGPVLEYGTRRVAEVSEEDVKQAIAKFRGQITQLPPVFSALKMDGKPLYEYAREGIPLPRAIEPRECEVSSLEAGNLRDVDSAVLPQNIATEAERKFAEQVTGVQCSAIPSPVPATGALLDLTFSVSSGTYIRTLIHDIGEALGTKAHMVKLTRDRQGDWEVGKNVLPLSLFDKDHDTWWPVLDTVLKEGPQRRLEVEIVEERAGTERAEAEPEKAKPESVEPGSTEAKPANAEPANAEPASAKPANAEAKPENAELAEAKREQ